MEKKADELIGAFDIRAGKGAATSAGSMSGGNQQKVIIAREVDMGGDALIIAQPTRGLDVGAIEYIRRRILAERDKGRAILLVSFELDEIMNLCDRIATISKGSIVGVYNAGEVTERDTNTDYGFWNALSKVYVDLSGNPLNHIPKYTGVYGLGSYGSIGKEIHKILDKRKQI